MCSPHLNDLADNHKQELYECVIRYQEHALQQDPAVDFEYIHSIFGMEMDNSSPMPARLLCVLIQRCAVMLQGDNGLGRPRSRPAFLAFSQHLVPKLNESAYATYLQGAELERDITTIWYYAIQLYLQSLDRPLNPQSGAAMPAVDSKTQAAKNILELFQAFHKRQALAEWQPSPKDENHLISVSSLADFSPHCVQEPVSGDKTGVVGYAIEALSRLSDSKKQEAQASNRLGPLCCVKSTWPIKTLLFFCGVIACAGTLLYLNVGLSGMLPYSGGVASIMP